MTKRLHIVRFACIALLAIALTPSHAQQTAELLSGFPRSELTIATPDARLHRFKVWMAVSNAQRERGLMFVKSLADDEGMLFVYHAPQPVSMWMKNTFIPLDMLFIRADGKIARIAENTTPHSLDVVESKEPVLAVLELKGGTASRLGIKAGMAVRHQVFKR